ncbi:MAG TPA: DUF3298 domain-containing protein [Candidatus Paceibacterota bacterium]|nr:DUF3298 domain-containing protein [Candidatus Paceibacterota bacterium]
MTGMKAALISIVVLVLVIVGYVGWMYARPSVHLLSGVATSTASFEHVESAQYYDVDIVYPDRTPLWSPLERSDDLRARNEMETFLVNDLADFKQNSGVDSMSAENQAFLHENGAKYAYDANYKQFRSSNGKLLSYEFDIYVDTGGAHPNGYFKTFTFDGSGNLVTLPDFFQPGSDYLQKLSDAAGAQVAAQLTERMGAEASSTIFADGLAPIDSNFSNFVIDGNNLVILIEPYQAASYAAGTFEVRIPLAQLVSIIRREWR